MTRLMEPEDMDTWLRGPYEEIVALQKPCDPRQDDGAGGRCSRRDAANARLR